MGGAHSSENDGVPRCWNGDPEPGYAALVGPQRGGQTTSSHQVAGSRWKQAAQDRVFWNSLQKTYVQQ
ncbi:jg11367 [Pararge aegeria aegeria]|uniref:Jg11367 protein n=1 Tax=Pararge aegeria aegeria TaxID=348720 RepID=A0A8S4RLU0_9NEOP|nr:jg11367 [Pararge aegeria aegeria]